MKTITLYIICSMLILISNCGVSQNNTYEKQADYMLLEFYAKHFQVWEIPSLPSDVRYEKLDSLMEKYCTSKLRNKAREVFKNVGADFLTNDLIGNLNENLKVERDTANENGYFVSFVSDIDKYTDAPGEAIKKQVVLHVTVIKEKDGYKIDYVK